MTATKEQVRKETQSRVANTRVGDLTPAQFEILEVIWPNGRCGRSVAEIWKILKANDKKVSRTTVLNQVLRLESRGWLSRQAPNERQTGKAVRFVVTTGPKRAKMELARKVLDDYFDGSITNFIVSSLGSKRPNHGRTEKLIEVLKDREEERLSKEEYATALYLLCNEGN